MELNNLIVENIQKVLIMDTNKLKDINGKNWGEIEEFKQFIKKYKLNDVFVDYNWFYENYNCNLFIYLRTSTKKQEFGREIIQIYEYFKNKNIKVFINNIYCDKYTGKKLNRKAYQEVRSILQSGDYLLTTNLNRLGRDYEGIKSEWYYFKYKNIKILIADKEVNEFISSPLPNEEENITLNRLYLQDMIFTNTIYRDCLKILEVRNSTKSGLEKARLQGKKIGKPRSKWSTKENFIKTLEYMINNNVGQIKATLYCKYPQDTFKKDIKKCYDKYNTKNYQEILNKIKEDTTEWEQF